MKLSMIPKYLMLLMGRTSDERLGFTFLARVARRVLPGYRLTWPELAWFADPELNSILTRFDEQDGLNAHRRLALQELLRLTAGVPGDTAECGVYKGCGSYIILRSNQRSIHRRVHHVFDSFGGLSAPAAEDGAYWRTGDLAVSEQMVRENLGEFSDVEYHKGWIPERFGDVDDRAFSFVHVDVDLYQPTLDSVVFFYPRLSDGGILVCDDYGFLTCPGATEALDRFLADKPEKMLRLPGGGGFFIKGANTETAADSTVSAERDVALSGSR
jgi:hypothetical protein